MNICKRGTTYEWSFLFKDLGKAAWYCNAHNLPLYECDDCKSKVEPGTHAGLVAGFGDGWSKYHFCNTCMFIVYPDIHNCCTCTPKVVYLDF